MVAVQPEIEREASPDHSVQESLALYRAVHDLVRFHMEEGKLVRSQGVLEDADHDLRGLFHSFFPEIVHPVPLAWPSIVNRSNHGRGCYEDRH